MNEAPMQTLGEMPFVVPRDDSNSSPEFRVLCYGDSLTTGFCAFGKWFEPYGRALSAALAASGVSCEVSVCGQSGHTAARMLEALDAEGAEDMAGTAKGLRQALDAAPSKPDLVLIMAGSYDLCEGGKPKDIFPHIRKLHEECHSRGIRTVALAPPPAPRDTAPAAARRLQLRSLLSQWAGDSVGEPGTAPQAIFIDPAELVPAGVADGADGTWDYDGMHFALAGSKRLGQRLSSLVAETLVHPMGKPSAEEGGLSLEAELAALAAKASGEEPEASSGSGPEPAATSGLEYWRARPPEKAEAFLGDIEDDFARGVLSRSLPIRSMALLFMDPEQLPCVGQELELRIGGTLDSPGKLAAIEHALTWDGGVIACVPEIEGAIGLPWGGVGAELLDVVNMGGSEAVVRVRAVTLVRLVGRQPARKNRGFACSLLQEVPEQGNEELGKTVESIEETTQSLQKLFNDCAELQSVSGYTAAGDFTSAPLEERVQGVLDSLKDIRLWGARGEADAAIRKAAAVTHAIVAAFSPSVRVKFLCEPQTLLPRLRKAEEFLEKVQSLLRTRMAFRRAFDDDKGSQA